MAIYYEYNIAVAPHVKKFVDKHFGEGAIPVGKGDPVGRILLASLKNEVQRPTKSPVEVKLIIHERRKSESLAPGKWLSAKGAGYINEYFTDLYDLKFYTFITLAIVSDGKKMTEAITEFRALYSINEDDLGFNAMEKAFFRIRKKFDLPNIKTLKNSGQACPILSDMFDAILLRDGNYAIHRHRKANE